MGKFMELIYDVLFSPGKAFPEIAAGRYVRYSLAAMLLSIIIPLGAIYLALKTAGLPQAVHVVIVIQVLGSLIVWFLGAAVWNLVAEFFGGRGTGLGLFTALGFAQLPRIFLVPLGVLSMVLPAEIRSFWLAATGLVVLFWTLTLDVYAIRGAYTFSVAKAVLVLLTPLLAMIIMMIMVIAFMSVSFLHFVKL
ncbi:Hypothetical protein LUCI_1599 [Lucifera butyrica]|uniref:Yip1 domain-containing protein n=1 Tax=Lucifera butyrica TaxID=1351585 RepID=A0A498RB70_9FIRM|nr:Yip1 family protein [Lucifera butyrica]VBB06368.1 Hypothetical protein LUCI_1599 [Lucifera butyrica]